MEKSQTTSVIDLFAVETIRGIDATSQDVLLTGTDQDDSWLVLGNVNAGNGYTAGINLGSGNDAVRVYGNVAARDGGKTDIRAETIAVSGDVVANSGGRNELGKGWEAHVSIAGKLEANLGDNELTGDSIIVKGVVSASGSIDRQVTSSNSFRFNKITFESDLIASPAAYNTITYNGSPDSPKEFNLLGNMIAESDGYSSRNSVFFGYGSDSIMIGGGVFANGIRASNRIIGNEKGPDTITVHGLVEAKNGGMNELWAAGMPLYLESPTKGQLILHSGIVSSSGGLNVIGADSMQLKSVETTDEGSICTIYLGEAYYPKICELSIDEGIQTLAGGTTEIRCSGDSIITINGGLISDAGVNKIYMLDESNTSYYEGTRDYTISINGGCTVTDALNGYNLIDGGAGSEFIHLNGHVSVNGLYAKGGEGYDVLTLTAESTEQFSGNYQAWLENAAATSGDTNANLDTWGLESVQVELTGNHDNLESLAWLGNVVQSYNAANATPMDLELKVDTVGQNLSLGDFFAGRTDDIFTALNMDGETANTLQVSGSLADNGVDAYTFKVHGDSDDTVQLSGEWFYIGDGASNGNEPAYSYYTTGFDLLMVESEISVIFGA